MTTKLPTIKPVLTIWETAIFAAIVTAEHWVPWADEVITRMRQAPMWVLMMSISNDTESLNNNMKGAFQHFDIPSEDYPFYPFYVGHRVNMLKNETISAQQMLEDQWIRMDDQISALEHFLPAVFDAWYNRDEELEEDLYDTASRLHATDMQIVDAFAQVFHEWAHDAMQIHEWLLNESANYLVNLGEDPRLSHVIDGLG